MNGALGVDMARPDPDLDALVAAVRASSKYKAVCVEVIRNIGRRELAARANLKEAIKATKNKLHQIGAAYLPTAMRYDQWTRELRAAAEAGDPSARRAACARIMSHHASTRERLPVLDEFYATALREIAPVHSVIDIACGLNPLAIPWMPLAPDATYYAYDMYDDMMAFIAEFFRMIGRRGQALAGDVLSLPSFPEAELALFLKAIPCLEQMDKAAAHRLMDILPTRYILVSFPVSSIGGRDKHMRVNYEAHFAELVRSKPWRVQRFAFSTELAFLVTKQSPIPR